MLQQSVYWQILEIVVFAVFGVGAIANLVFWFRAAKRPSAQSPARDLVWAVLQRVVVLFQPRFLGSFLLDALFQRRLLRVSGWRWLAHSLLFWGNVILFFVGSLGLMLAERGLLPVTKDTPWFALTNEVAGLMVLLGVALSVFRYYRVEEQRFITSREGLVWLILLGMSAVSGYLVESARLAAEAVQPASGWYSFVGYPLARAVSPLFPDWSATYRALWWFHAGTAMALVASIPYGRLFHMFASPLAIAANLSAVTRTHHRDTAGAEGTRRTPATEPVLSAISSGGPRDSTQ